MTKVLIFKNENGNVTTYWAAEGFSLDDALAEKITDTNFARIVDFSTLPNSDDDFYDAWEIDANSITVNLGKAKEITKERLRYEREPLLLALDVQYQRAAEAGSDTTAIVAEKDRLRNITNLADAATTLDELRALNCN
jgi:hypothetical protein